MIIDKRPEDIEKKDIEALLKTGVSERRELDYKASLPGPSDKEKIEFLCDVSSFANTSGGFIFYGISEQRDENGKSTGIPEDVVGVSKLSMDQEILKFESILRDGVKPRIPGVIFREISGFSGGSVLMVFIPKSWISPHMVSKNDSSMFYARNNRGKNRLDVDEIRTSFLSSDSLGKKVKDFRLERVSKVMGDDTPVILTNAPKIVFHVIPLQNFTRLDLISGSMLANQSANATPICGEYSMMKRFNVDGYLNFCSISGDVIISYVQLFRNGAIEAVDAALLDNPQKQIRHLTIENKLMNSLDSYLRVLIGLGLNSPVVIMVSLIGVKGYKMEMFAYPYFSKVTHSIDRDVLLLPEILVEDISINAAEILKPVFDMLWQACGYEGSKNYLPDGKRKTSENV